MILEKRLIFNGLMTSDGRYLIYFKTRIIDQLYIVHTPHFISQIRRVGYFSLVYYLTETKAHRQSNHYNFFSGQISDYDRANMSSPSAYCVRAGEECTVTTNFNVCYDLYSYRFIQCLLFYFVILIILLKIIGFSILYLSYVSI